MKLATRINSFLPKFDNNLEKVFAEFKNLGLTHVDLNYPEHVVDYSPDEMKKILSENNLELMELLFVLEINLSTAKLETLTKKFQKKLCNFVKTPQTIVEQLVVK